MHHGLRGGWTPLSGTPSLSPIIVYYFTREIWSIRFSQVKVSHALLDRSYFERETARQTGRLTGCLAGWLTDWLVDSLKDTNKASLSSLALNPLFRVNQVERFRDVFYV